METTEFGIETVLMELAQALTVFEAMAKCLAVADEACGTIDYENAPPPSLWAQTGAGNSMYLVISRLEGEFARMTRQS